MTRMKQSVSYLTITGGLIALMYWIIVLGTKLDQKTLATAAEANTLTNSGSQWTNFINGL